MCVGEKEETILPIWWRQERINDGRNVRLIKPRLPRTVVPSSRVNLNLYWEKLEAAYHPPGTIHSSRRHKLSNLTNGPDSGQGETGDTAVRPIRDLDPIFGCNETGGPKP